MRNGDKKEEEKFNASTAMVLCASCKIRIAEQDPLIDPSFAQQFIAQLV